MTDSSRTREHLEVLADALATPGKGADLPTRAREAFAAELAKCAGSYDACCEEHHDAALAAVIAVVQEDRTREIVAAFRAKPLGEPPYRVVIRSDDWAANFIEHEFGGTTHG